MFENSRHQAINIVKKIINCDPIFDQRLVIINKNDFYLTEWHLSISFQIFVTFRSEEGCSVK